uniref:Uncharacterized protein n=1 Tax=Rhizophora mucronata TaxID=61149 RepID=A0A2P2Q6S7_RHIMU
MKYRLKECFISITLREQKLSNHHGRIPFTLCLFGRIGGDGKEIVREAR